MKKLAIIAVLPFTLTAAMCSTVDRREFCNEKLGIPSISERGPDDVETADNDYDTDQTVARVKIHNAAVERVCSVVPAPQQ